jgi:hypothetical protein
MIYVNEQYQNAELGNLMFGNSRGNYHIDRSIYGPLWNDIFSKLNFSRGGYDGKVYKNNVSYDEGVEKFENDVFIMRVYFWGDDEEIEALPNFLHKKSGLEIQWYKYPLRDSYSNVKLTPEKFTEILQDCKRSMPDEIYNKPTPVTKEQLEDIHNKISNNSLYGITGK